MSHVHPHDHGQHQGHGAGHAHIRTRHHAHAPASPHPAMVLPPSFMRLSIAWRLGVALLASIVLWCAVWLAMR